MCERWDRLDQEGRRRKPTHDSVPPAPALICRKQLLDRSNSPDKRASTSTAAKRSLNWSRASRQSRCTAASAHSTASSCISNASAANWLTSSNVRCSSDPGLKAWLWFLIASGKGDGAGTGAACRSRQTRSVIDCNRDMNTLLLLLLLVVLEHRRVREMNTPLLMLLLVALVYRWVKESTDRRTVPKLIFFVKKLT